MKHELADIEKIANNPAAPTFENTIAEMERSGVLLRRVGRVFSGITQLNTNPTLQKVQTELAPKQAAHRDAINPHFSPAFCCGSGSGHVYCVTF